MLTYINIGKHGRFGDQLFQIAATIGIAKKYGYQYGFLPWEFQQYFKNSLPRYTRLEQNKGLAARHICPPCRFPLHYVEFRPSPVNSLHGLMQTEKYFLHCESAIRHYFDMKPIKGLPEIEEGATAIYYLTAKNQIAGYPVQKKEYYQKALTKLKPAGKIYVFSDDIKEAKTKIKGENFTYVQNKHFMHDFYMMQQCTNFVLANSSFSWWAAWLSVEKNKKVVAPENWYAPQMPGKHTDIYAKNWIVI